MSKKSAAEPVEEPTETPLSAEQISAMHAENVARAESEAAFREANVERAIVVGGGITKPAAAPTPAADRITCEVFARRIGRDPAVTAFEAEDRRLHGVRKLTRPEWDSLFAAFKKAPR